MNKPRCQGDGPAGQLRGTHHNIGVEARRPHRPQGVVRAGSVRDRDGGRYVGGGSEVEQRSGSGADIGAVYSERRQHFPLDGVG